MLVHVYIDVYANIGREKTLYICSKYAEIPNSLLKIMDSFAERVTDVTQEI